jgi:arsenite methyltransferase
MAADVEIDVQVLKSAIKKTYASVSQEPEKDFIFPTGRPWAADLGYPPELANVPETAVGSFAGVANPWQLGRLAPGEQVLDLGSGAGTDSLVAAQMVGEHGHVTGIDMTPEMLTKARAAAAEMGAANVEFVESEAEQLPFPDASYDVVISNGVIDLIPDKDAVFAEIFRVLSPGGRIQIADVTIQNPVSAEGRRNIDLWTGRIAGALLEAASAKLLERHGFERIETGLLVDTYARSKFEDTRRKAQKFGARGTTVKAYKAAQK